MLKRLSVGTCLVVAIAAGAVAGARADSTPIGPLPSGPTTKVETQRGALVAVALPLQKPSSGLVWRIARNINVKVLRQVSEADVGSNVVVIFRVTGRGHAFIRFALTRGDSSSKALKSMTYDVTVR